MATIQDQIAQARAAGYDDAAIVAHLGGTPDLGPKITTALSTGYAPVEILSHLTDERVSAATPVVQAPVKPAEQPISFGSPMGDIVGEAFPNTILDREPAIAPPVSPTTSFAPVKPEMRKAARAAWNSATPEQRTAMQAQPGWRGQLAREQAGLVEGISPETSGVMAEFDPRVEARTRQLLLRGEQPEFAAGTAQKAARAGVTPGKEVEFVRTTEGLADEGKDFRPGESLSSMVEAAEAAPAGAKPVGMGEITSNALVRGALQTQGMGSALLAAGAKSVGADDLALSLLKNYFVNTAEAKKYPADIENFTKIDSWSDVPTYAIEAVLENLPQLVGTVGLGTIGGIVAKRFGARAVADMVAEQAAKALFKRQALGVAVGAGTSAIGMEVGSIYGDIARETKQERPGVALAFGTVAGALDAIPAMRAARTILGPSATSWAVKEIVKRYGAEAGKQLLAEGGTEFLQTWVEKAATSYVDGRSLLTKENLVQAVDAFLKGGISGTATGVATKGISEVANRQANRELAETEKATKGAEAAKQAALAKWSTFSEGRTPAAPATPPTAAAQPAPSVPPQPTPSALGAITPEQTARISALAQQYVAAGIDENIAGLMAIATVKKEAEVEQAAQVAAAPPVAPPVAPPPEVPPELATRVADIEDELINAGVPPDRARADALTKAQEEAADDAAAAAEEPAPVSTPPTVEEPPNAGQPIDTAGGAGPSVAGVTDQGISAPGVESVEPVGVVPTGEDVGKPTVGEGQQSPAVTAKPLTVTRTKLTKDASGVAVTQLTLSDGSSETISTKDGKWYGEKAGYLGDTKKDAIEKLTSTGTGVAQPATTAVTTPETKEPARGPEAVETKQAEPKPPEAAPTAEVEPNTATPKFFDYLALPKSVPIRNRLLGKDVTSEEVREALLRHSNLPKVSAATKEAISSFLKLTQHFTPGNIVTSYGGADKVLAFNWNDGNWSVEVEGVTQQPAGNWVGAGRKRTHSTYPGKDYKIIEKSPTVSEGEDLAPQMSSIGAAPASGKGDTTVSARPSANVQRLATMLGAKLYGTPSDLATVSVKELFQNSFDAIKGAIEKGLLTKGKINVAVDDATRTITVTDNGLGMPTSVMGNQFLQIAGTVKETERASGGLGVAKMLFLFGNKKLEVVSLRDGVVSRMVTTGEDLKSALDDPSRGPKITVSSDPATVKYYTDTMFPDGHGTAISIQIPKSYTDSSTGDEKPIEIPTYRSRYEVLNRSPLFDNIEVTFTDGAYTSDVPIGAKFPLDDYTPFSNVKFEWGTARIYVSKKPEDKWRGNTHILSNGLWQFDTEIKAGNELINRDFYIDLSPAKGVKPEDPGYPFDLNRQNFSKQAQGDFAKIFKYISIVYSQADFASSIKNFGTVQYLNADGSMTPAVTLEPTAPPSENAFTVIKPDDKVEVRDGVMYVNNRAVPELSTKDLESASIKVEELTIPQGQLDPRKVMVHDNTKEKGTAEAALTDEEIYDKFVSSGSGVFGETLPDGGVRLTFYDAKTFEDTSVVEADNKEDMVSHLRDIGLVPERKDTPSLSDKARAKFGERRFNAYIAGIGNTFITLRDTLAQHGAGYVTKDKSLSDEVVGTSIDTKYYGVSTIVPFRGMFINPAATETTASAREIATNLMGTMAHELAHFKQRNHNANFASELQSVINVFDSFDGTGEFYSQLKQDLTRHIAANRDIFDFLNQEFTNGNFESRGNRFKDAGYQQIGDEGSLADMEATVPPGGGQGQRGVPPGAQPGAPSAGQVGIPPGNVGQAAPAGVPTVTPAVVRTQKQIDKDVAIATDKFVKSQTATEAAEATHTLLKLRDGEQFVKLAASNTDAMTNKVLSATLFVLPTDVVAKWGSSVLGSENLNNTNDLIGNMRGMQHQLLKAAGLVSENMMRAIKADPSLRTKLEEVVYTATIARVDPSLDPTLGTGKDERSPPLFAKYKNLGPEGQRIYNELKTYYESMVDYYGFLLDEQVKASNLPTGAQAVIMAEIKKLYEVDKRIVPYFPLVRNRGDYWLRVGEGKLKEFYTFGTIAERDAVMDQVAKRKNTTVEAMLLDKKQMETGDDLTSFRIAGSEASEMLKSTFAKIDAVKNTGGQSPAVFAQSMSDLKDSIYDLFLTTLPDQSFRKSFIARKDIIGFNVDIVRNFSTSAMHMGGQLARIAYSAPIRNSLAAAQKSLEGNPKKSKYERFVQEMQRRAALELHPFADPAAGISKAAQQLGGAVADVSTRLSFIHYLSSASSALIQLSTIPYGAANLGARHGYAKALAELSKLTPMWNTFGVRKQNPDGSVSWFMPTMAESTNVGLNADEQRAMKAMGTRGVDITLTNELLGRGRVSSASYEGAMQKVGRVGMTIVGGLFHNMERISREVIFMTSYRLSRKAGKTHDQAVDQAVADTYDSAGNMAEWNRAPAFRGAPGRLAMQFLSYPMFQTVRIGKTFANMLPFLNQDGKTQALKEFAGIMGVTWMLAGTVGLPLFSVLIGAVGFILDKMKDEDKPEDLKSLNFEEYFKQVWVPEKLGDTKLFGKPVSDLVLQGPTNFFTGLDISARTSLNDLWFKDRITSKNPREEAISFAVAHAGPSVNLALSYLDGYKAYKDGDMQKFGEKVLPAVGRGPMAAWKYFHEGAKDVHGSELMSRDSFTTGALLAQAIGFRNTELSNLQAVNFKMYSLGQKIGIERTNILRNLGDAYIKDQPARMAKWEEEVGVFNKKFPIKGLQITAENLIASRKRVEGLRAKSWKGMALTPANIALFVDAAAPTRDAAEWLETQAEPKAP